MIGLLWRFALYNLLPAVASGLLLWLLIYGGLALLGVRRGSLRLPLLYFPLVKSTLLLLGIGLIFPWPRPVFKALAERAVDAQTMLPALLIWAGAALLVRQWLIRGAQRRMLADARPAEQTSDRLSQALRRVMQRYRARQGARCEEGLLSCTIRPSPPPELLVTEQFIESPLVFPTEKPPTIVFPAALISQLTDSELDSALAHEYAHVLVNRPFWCSEACLKYLGPVSPVAGLVARYLHREEELTCDEMAVLVTGDPNTVASMLLKSYRFSAGSRRLFSKLQVFSQLLGLKPEITQRVERLLEPEPSRADLWLQRCAAMGIWVAVLSMFSLF